MNKYTQVKLKKGDMWSVVWIPTKYAVVGDTIKIKTKRGWGADWKIVEVYSSLPYRPHPEGAARKHKERTGDEPK